jgi:heptosyltransferase-2
MPGEQWSGPEDGEVGIWMIRKSVLIIKHGLTDSCGQMARQGIRYSDILRSTCLLEDYKGHEVTWITSEAAHDLFLDNHLIDRLMVVEKACHLVPKSIGDFHIVINLENSDDWRHFAAEVSAQHRYGFIGPPTSPGVINDEQAFQESLYRHLGREWTGQRYCLGYQSRSDVMYDIGFNSLADPELPVANWPEKNWHQLYHRLKEDYRISQPKSMDDLQDYMEWIASCRLVVSPDTLGLHLAIAMKKNVVALVNAATPQQLYLYGRGPKLHPVSSFGCPACDLANANLPHSCMEEITVATVQSAVEGELSRGGDSRQLESSLFTHRPAYADVPHPA